MFQSLVLILFFTFSSQQADKFFQLKVGETTLTIFLFAACYSSEIMFLNCPFFWKYERQSILPQNVLIINFTHSKTLSVTQVQNSLRIIAVMCGLQKDQNAKRCSKTVLFQLYAATGFSEVYNNKGKMRSKQRKTYRNSQQHIEPPRSPNAHLKKQLQLEKTEPFRINKPPLSPHPQSPNPKQPALSIDQLLKENSQLRKEIIELKVHQFYHFDDLKLKELINQLQSLRKQVKKYKEEVNHLQLQNDFLLRTNQQLKLELQREIRTRTKDSFNQEGSKYTYKSISKCQEDVSHLNSQTVYMQDSALEETLEIGRQESMSKKSKYRMAQKCFSPRKSKDSLLDSANEYLLYRRNKQKKTSSEKHTN